MMALTDYPKLEAFALEHTDHPLEEWAMDAYGEIMQGFENHGAQEQGSITIRALRLQTGHGSTWSAAEGNWSSVLS